MTILAHLVLASVIVASAVAAVLSSNLLRAALALGVGSAAPGCQAGWQACSCASFVAL